jgi:hypothetical protein
MFDPAAPTAPFDAAHRNPPDRSVADWIASLAGVDPQNPNQFAPPPTDDELGQANMQALEDKLSSTGDFKDAVALYMARKASRG